MGEVDHVWSTLGTSSSERLLCKQAVVMVRQLRQVHLQQRQAPAQRHDAGGQIFLSDQRAAAGQIQVIRKGGLHPLVHPVP